MVGSAGVGVTPGPSHWMSGVPVTPESRVTVQVRVTLSPAIIVEEGKEVREMRAVCKYNNSMQTKTMNM